MVKIRLKRMGSRKRPYYRVVVVDSRKPLKGRTLEEIGHYRPVEDGLFSVNKERAIAWMGHGAQPTDTVRNLFRKNGVRI